MNNKNWSFPGVLIRFAALSVIGLGGCFQLDPAGSEDLARGAASAGTVTAADRLHPPSATVAQAVGRNPPSSLSDGERERRRKVSQVMAFYRIQSGMTVLDLYSDGGYYTEQLSSVVGHSGRVVAYNKRPDQRLTGVEIENPYAEGRFPNVEVILNEDGQLDLPPGTFDLVLMIQVLHDIYAGSEVGGGPSVANTLAEIYRSMRPGAVLGIVDHVAAKGAPASTGGTLHRLDPDLIKRDVTAAGFLFDGESDVLRNFDDDYTQPVFNESIRGRSDRIVLRFRKPVR